MSAAAALESFEDECIDVFIGRQPIFDSNMRVVGSELLYQDADDDLPVYDATVCSKTIVSAFLDLGIDSLVGDGAAYLNLPRELLLSPCVEALPADKVVLQFTAHVTVCPAVVARLGQLKEAGYTIALEDFVYRPRLAPLVEVANIVKIGVQHKHEMHETLQALSGFEGRLLAQQITDPDDMNRCCNLGFHLFQGFFLCQPSVTTGRSPRPRQLGTMRVLAKLCDPDVTIEDLESVVRSDVALSCRLLRYLNSALFALRHSLRDIRQALALIGLTKLRAWMSMIAIATIDSKPAELTRIALVRARMCELLARQTDNDPAAAFTVGLFSVLDSLLDRDMTTALKTLPLRQDINRALIAREGNLGALLSCVELHESGQWSSLRERGLYASVLTNGYIAANRWANDVLDGMH